MKRSPRLTEHDRRLLDSKPLPADLAVAELAQLGNATDLGATAHYEDAPYYSNAYRARNHDVAYYVALAKKHRGPVLEYGVGNGRVALAIAQAGIEVVGVDLSRPMLSDFQTHLKALPKTVQQRIKLRCGDMRRVSVARRFPLVIAPFNVVLHLYTRRDVEQFLNRVHAHLSPGGRFVFDFSAPRVQDLAQDTGKTFKAPPFRHPTHGGVVRYQERFEYDSLRQITLCRMEFAPTDGSPGWQVPLTHRQFFPQEMQALLHYNGFTAQRWSADFSDEAISPDTDSFVVTCRAKEKVSRRP